MRRKGERRRGTVVKEERRLKSGEEFGLLPLEFYFRICPTPDYDSPHRSKSRSKGHSSSTLLLSSSSASLRSILKKSPSNFDCPYRLRQRSASEKRVTICEERNELQTRRSLDTLLSHKKTSRGYYVKQKRKLATAKRRSAARWKRAVGRTLQEPLYERRTPRMTHDEEPRYRRRKGAGDDDSDSESSSSESSSDSDTPEFTRTTQRKVPPFFPY